MLRKLLDSLSGMLLTTTPLFVDLQHVLAATTTVTSAIQPLFEAFSSWLQKVTSACGNLKPALPLIKSAFSAVWLNYEQQLASHGAVFRRLLHGADENPYLLAQFVADILETADVATAINAVTTIATVHKSNVRLVWLIVEVLVSASLLEESE